MAERPVMYLEQEDWSPRYQDTFYTVRLDDFQRFASTPKTATSNNDSDSLPSSTLGGKTNFPAYYYKIQIFCGRHDPKVVFRRYSQFKWLYQNIPLSTTGGDPSEEPIQFPPGNGCLCSQNDDFAKNRTEQLREFLNEALVRRDVARDEAVAQFLELDSFVKTEKS
ncbi:unnamed protein product [Pseudo-nitzschia multistriata]|uniref:PX domain-containing protein n=1 Tax=Pseudo-nitzschia multistriata TaxID=183589 RepID=A0A448Z203_9STRA|nr:unnamed protein product [Pseudo-nitzschia multistriata]